MKIAIAVGHSRSGDKGAISVGGMSEWDYNVKLAALVQDWIVGNSSGVSAKVISDYAGESYSSAMSDAADQIKAFGADVAVELHFNSASASAQGFEHLYWSTSQEGKRLASLLVDEQAKAFPWQSNRGAKPKTGSDRGAGFLSKTHCPAAICEPFFGSNEREWKNYSSGDSMTKLAGVYARALTAFLGVSLVGPEPASETDGDALKEDILASVAAIRWQCDKIEAQFT